MTIRESDILAARRPARKRRQPETGLQLAVAQFLDMTLPEDAVWHHSPNEGARNPAFAALLKRKGTRAGWPDIEIIYSGGIFAIELKNKNEPLLPSQEKLHPRLTIAGARLAICRSVVDVQNALDTWNIPTRARVFGFVKREAA